MDGEVGGDRGLRCGEALRYGGAAEDAACARGVPEGAGVGEEVGTDVCQRQEGEDVLNGGVVREGFGRFDQGWMFRHRWDMSVVLGDVEVGGRVARE